MVHSWKACRELDSARAGPVPRPAERRDDAERGHLDAMIVNPILAGRRIPSRVNVVWRRAVCQKLEKGKLTWRSCS